MQDKTTDVLICSLSPPDTDTNTTADNTETTESSGRFGESPHANLATEPDAYFDSELIESKGVQTKDPHVDVCLLCSEPYECDEVVYQSNNPVCQHRFHKRCIKKWLNYQSSCPICNQPYLLLNV